MSDKQSSPSGNGHDAEYKFMPAWMLKRDTGTPPSSKLSSDQDSSRKKTNVSDKDDEQSGSFIFAPSNIIPFKELPTDAPNGIYTKAFLLSLRSPNSKVPHEEAIKSMKDAGIWTDGVSGGSTGLVTGLTSAQVQSQQQQQRRQQQQQNASQSMQQGLSGRGSVGGSSARNVRPQSSARSTKRGGLPQDDKGAKRPSKKRDGPELLFANIQSLLNKLTLENFDKLSTKLIELFKTINSSDILEKAVERVHNKALTEPPFAAMYSELCKKLNDHCPTFDNGKINFRTILLNKCQEAFEAQMSKEKAYLNEETLQKERRRAMGNVIFIGELFKVDLISSKRVLGCIEYLLRCLTSALKSVSPNATDDLETNCEKMCNLLTTVGEKVDSRRRKKMDEYMRQLEVFSKHESLALRYRFMIKDVIDLRKNKWTPRRIKEMPQTIQAIHSEAAEGSTVNINLTTATLSSAVTSTSPTTASLTATTSSQPQIRVVLKSEVSHNDIEKTKMSSSLSPNVSNNENEITGTENTALTLEQEITMLIEEYLLNRDIDDVLQCIGESVRSEKLLENLIQVSVPVVLERSEADCQLLASLFVILSQHRLLTPAHLFKGFKRIVETMEDVQLDVPLVDKIVGYFIGLALFNHCIEETAVKELYRCTKPQLAAKLSNHISETLKQLNATASHISNTDSDNTNDSQRNTSKK
jgi:hypothetical protein